MTTDRQANDRRNEARHFKAFRRLAAPLVPNGPVTHAEMFGEPTPEGAPDFLVRASDQVLGIEHRELVKPHSEGKPDRAKEAYAAEIMTMGQELADLRGTPAARVSVLFGRDLPDTRSARLNMARALADLVHQHVNEEDGNVRLDYVALDSRELRGVETVFINRIARFDKAARWINPRAGWVLSDCISLVQKAINDKAVKYSTYRQFCDECWLLLVADSFNRPSGAIHPSTDSLTHIYSSPFDRTMFLDLAMGHVHHLKTDRAG